MTKICCNNVGKVCHTIIPVVPQLLSRDCAYDYSARAVILIIFYNRDFIRLVVRTTVSPVSDERDYRCWKAGVQHADSGGQSVEMCSSTKAVLACVGRCPRQLARWRSQPRSVICNWVMRRDSERWLAGWLVLHDNWPENRPRTTKNERTRVSPSESIASCDAT